jgi:hypothetical protein
MMRETLPPLRFNDLFGALRLDRVLLCAGNLFAMALCEGFVVQMPAVSNRFEVRAQFPIDRFQTLHSWLIISPEEREAFLCDVSLAGVNVASILVNDEEYHAGPTRILFHPGDPK